MALLWEAIRNNRISNSSLDNVYTLALKSYTAFLPACTEHKTASMAPASFLPYTQLGSIGKNWMESILINIDFSNITDL
jgi:hypothetical protein